MFVCVQTQTPIFNSCVYLGSSEQAHGEGKRLGPSVPGQRGPRDRAFSPGEDTAQETELEKHKNPQIFMQM